MTGLFSLVLWPLKAVWRFVAVIFEITGRLLAILLGTALMIIGIVVSLTVIGSIVGIPLTIVGLLLIIRGIF